MGSLVCLVMSSTAVRLDRLLSRWRTPPLGEAQRRTNSGSRREILTLNALAASLTFSTEPQSALARTKQPETDQPPAVVMKLTRCNGAFCTYYTVDDQRFRAVVDTGSPFLMVDGRCGPAPTPYCFATPVRSVDMEDMSDEGYGGQAHLPPPSPALALSLQPSPCRCHPHAPWLPARTCASSGAAGRSRSAAGRLARRVPPRAGAARRARAPRCPTLR